MSNQTKLFIISLCLFAPSFLLDAAGCERPYGRCVLPPVCTPDGACTEIVEEGYCTPEKQCVLPGQRCAKQSGGMALISGQYVVRGGQIACAIEGESCSLDETTGLVPGGEYKMVNNKLTCVKR